MSDDKYLPDKAFEMPEPVVEKPPVEPPKEKPAKIEQVPVRTISRTPSVALVQWADKSGPRRAYVPREAIADGEVSRDMLELGTQVGLPWEDYLKSAGMAAKEAKGLAARLREHGIFTLDDMRRHLPQARQAFEEMAMARVIDLLKAAEAEEAEHAR